MSDFQAIRLGPRIFDLNRAVWIDLPFDLDEDPDTMQSELSVLRSESGAIETMPSVPYARLRAVMQAMDAKARREVKILYDRTLALGGTIELVRDIGRYFWLVGDSARDVEAGQPPLPGSRYTLVSGDFASTPGWISVNTAQVGSRVNLVENGDAIDGAATWTNPHTDRLQISSVRYLPPNGLAGKAWEFVALTGLTKTAKITFSLDGYTTDALPDDALTVSFKWRTSAPSGGSFEPITSMRIGVPSDHFQDVEIFGPTIPSRAWTTVVKVVDMSGVSAADSTAEFIIDFEDGELFKCPIYITELQIEPGKWATGFVPYSTARDLPGERTDDDFLRYLNGLAYRHQYPAILNGTQWGFTVGMTVHTYWYTDDGTPNGATVVLYTDTDSGSANAVGALKITADETTVYAAVTLMDDTSVTVSAEVTWSPSVGKRIVVSVNDGDGTTDSGQVDLYIDGTLADSLNFDPKTIRQGAYFMIGSDPSGDLTAAARFSHVVLAPVYIDGDTVTIEEFDDIDSDLWQRPDRNSWRCVLDPAQRGRSDRVTNNQVNLDLSLIEVIS